MMVSDGKYNRRCVHVPSELSATDSAAVSAGCRYYTQLAGDPVRNRCQCADSPLAAGSQMWLWPPRPLQMYATLGCVHRIAAFPPTYYVSPSLVRLPFLSDA